MWNEHFENIVAVMVHGFWSVLDILGVTFAMAILILSTKGKIFIINLRATSMDVLKFMEVITEIFTFILILSAII